MKSSNFSHLESISVNFNDNFTYFFVALNLNSSGVSMFITSFAKYPGRTTKGAH